MKTLFVQNEFTYDGSQLKSHFGYLKYGVKGDSILSWIGPCSVSFDHMVDGEDLLAGETIAGDRMVHFIVEKFHTPLFGAVTLQRLLAAIVLEIFREHVGDGKASGQLRREGDDVFWGPGKMSISIATLTPVSALIHFAVNCTNRGTPVRTASLEDIGLDPEEFARKTMKCFVDEVAAIEEATVKVRWVK